MTWVVGLGVFLPGKLALSGEAAPAQILIALGMTESQLDDLLQEKPVAYSLKEGSADELSVGVARFLAIPVARAVEYLRRDDPGILDIDVTAHGGLSDLAGDDPFARFEMPGDELKALLGPSPSDEFNLSAQEIKVFEAAKALSPKAALDEAGQQYRKILRQRFEAYRQGGLGAIAPYVRTDSRESSPARELRQAAAETDLLARHLSALHKAWLNYPAALPPGAREAFIWVSKIVEERPTAILRHRVDVDWNGGVLVLTREFYVGHSYNSSQWLTGCLPWRDGAVVFQQVRTFTEQVAGLASGPKHFVGRELLKGAMLKTLEHLHEALSAKAASR
ncbi:MAG: hypothetical protein H6R26_544 [Proteobacteria bacterium]|nr:hypothetical protein [Pseudomonadota bacterium]